MIEESGVRRNFATLLAGDLVNRLLRFVATIALARALTLQGFGLVNTAVAVSGVVVVLTTFGLSEVGARDIAVVPARARPLVRRVAAVRSAAAALVLLASLGTALLLAPGYAGLTLAAGVMALGMSASGEWALRGLERMRRLAVAWIAGGATVAAGSVGLALAGGGPVLAVWVWALGELVVAFLTWRAVRRTAPSEESVEGPLALIRRAWPVGAAGVIVYGYTANIDTVILAVARSPSEAGLYSAPYRMFLVTIIVPAFAAYSVLPALSRASATGQTSLARDLLVRVLGVLFCYGLLIVGLVLVFGADLLELLFGPSFGSMGDTFALLSLAVAWYAVGYPAGYSLIAAGENRRFLMGAATAGGLNVALNLVLIPRHGPIGAAVATAVSFAAASVVWLYLRGLLAGKGWWLPVALAGVSTGVAVAAAEAALQSAGVVALVLAGVGAAWTVASRSR